MSVMRKNETYARLLIPRGKSNGLLLTFYVEIQEFYVERQFNIDTYIVA